MEFWRLLGFKTLYGETAVGVKNMDRAIDWYCSMFGLVKGHNNGTEATLGYFGGNRSEIIPLISLLQIPHGPRRP